MGTGTLKDILRQEILGYTGEGFNARNYLTISPDGNLFTVITFARLQDESHIVETGLVARIIGDKIVIDLDLNNKTLLDALLKAGVRRDQIIVAYAGETIQDERVA